MRVVFGSGFAFVPSSQPCLPIMGITVWMSHRRLPTMFGCVIAYCLQCLDVSSPGGMVYGMVDACDGYLAEASGSSFG